ncbi:MAG: WG repeat-containing protein, partial [Deltaproteobacteria bacterium]|nr:WG repeat-containing protein [Deltaproteobacteria bacterium]
MSAAPGGRESPHALLGALLLLGAAAGCSRANGLSESAAPAPVAAAPAPAPAVASGLPEPFAQADRWGFKGADGAVAIPARFVLAQPFSAQGIAAVVDERGWAYIDARGRVLLRPYVVDNGPDEFAEGLARCVEKDKLGYFDEKGQVVIAPAFDFGTPFRDGRARVCSGCTKQV